MLGGVSDACAMARDIRSVSNVVVSTFDLTYFYYLHIHKQNTHDNEFLSYPKSTPNLLNDLEFQLLS